MDGIALMKALHSRAPRFPVIVMTAHGDVPSAVAAMREGAFQGTLQEALDQAAEVHIRAALAATDNRRAEAAEVPPSIG